jgi:RND family efflux transporter MFP subunit
MKKYLLKAIVALVFTGIVTGVVQSCTDSKGNVPPIPKTSAPIPVKLIAIEKTIGTNVITASGKLTTDDETMLGFKTGGVVESVFVKEGDQVRKGQLLARLNLTEINALVSQAKHGLAKAERDFNRATNLYKDSVATLEQLQNAETALSVAREQYEAATFNKSHSEIHAPANGVVLRKFVNAGQVVGTGDPIIQTNGATAGEWILRIGVSDKQWSSLVIGQQATIKVDAFPNRTFKGRVIRKAGVSDSQTGVFAIEISVNSAGEKFASGMFAAAELPSAEKISSWSVPYEAVLDANDNEGFVFITNDNITATKQPVIIESFNGETIRISRGLEHATALIVSGSAYLSDQSSITVIK